MATHDYVIDNSTGANVRADINNALAAIVSNNSSSSEPSTKYAYMWWADTTTGILKIRNSANDGWVELLQLDGTLTLEDGTVSAPGLAFRDDLNTGVFSSASDTFNIATGGVERVEFGTATIFNDGGADVDLRIEGDTDQNLLFCNAGGNAVGIGTSTPGSKLHIFQSSASAATGNSGAGLSLESNNHQYIQYLGANTKEQGILFGDDADNDVGSIVYNHSDNKLTFATAANMRLMIDSDGRVLIGISSADNNFGGLVPEFQIEGTTTNKASMALHKNSNDAQAGFFCLSKSRGTSNGSDTIVQDGDEFGTIAFTGADGTDRFRGGAKILGRADGSPAENNMPGRLEFFTNSGSTDPSEKMRITSDGTVQIAASGAIGGFSSSHVISSGAPLKIYKSSTTTHAGLQLIWDHFNTTAGISQKIQFTIGDDASSDGFNNAGYIAIEKADSWQSGSGRSSAMAFATTSAATESEKMRILSNGDLFVGCTALPSTSVTGFAVSDNAGKCLTRHATSATTANNVCAFFNPNGLVGVIQLNGSGTTYVTTSDYRLKENATEISDGITKLKTLKPYRFNFKADPTKTVDGFFAHEVTAVPEAITGIKDEIATQAHVNQGLAENVGDPVYQGIDQSKLVPLLTAALREAIAKIEVLETKVAALEAA